MKISLPLDYSKISLDSGGVCYFLEYTNYRLSENRIIIFHIDPHLDGYRFSIGYTIMDNERKEISRGKAIEGFIFHATDDIFCSVAKKEGPYQTYSLLIYKLRDKTA